MLNANQTLRIKEFMVTCYLDGKQVFCKNFKASKDTVLTKCKQWYWAKYNEGYRPRFEIKEQYHEKSLTSIFLDADKKRALANLLKKAKDLYKSYPEEFEGKKCRLYNRIMDMWNSVQNEFFMTCDVCDNTIWKWEDFFEQFDRVGYLIEQEPEQLSDWSKLLEGWYHRDWAVEVLKIIKEFNLDNQKPEIVTVFQNDFKSVRSEKELHSALLKWYDLIFWSPWKLEMLENTFPQPQSSHWEDEFNPDIETLFNEEV
jgi:hypothetical protein